MDPITSFLFTAANNYTPINYNTALVTGSWSAGAKAWKWSSGYGFGEQYSSPVSGPSNVSKLRFVPNGHNIAMASHDSPYIIVYPWSNSTGFGTKVADPSSLPNATAGQSCNFSNLSDVVVLGHQVTDATSSSTVTAYPWSNSTGFGTKYADPSSLPSNGASPSEYVTGIDFRPPDPGTAWSVDSSICLTTYNSGSDTGVYMYDWSNSGFGTKWSDPGTPPDNALDCAFSKDGDYLAIAHKNGSYITVYALNASTWGSKVSDPTTLPGDLGWSVEFNPAGSAIVVGSGASPWLQGYPWTGTGFGTKYSNPSTAMANIVDDVAFDPNGEDIAATERNGTTHVYKFDASTGFGTKYSDPSTGTPTGSTVDFAP